MKKHFSIGSLVFIQLLGQFFIQLLIVRYLGLGIEADVYISSQSLSLLFGAIITSTIQSVWMPRFSNIERQQGMNEEVSIALTQIGMISIVLILFLTFLIHNWVSLFNPGFSEYQNFLYRKFTIISLFSLLFSNISSVLSTVLRSREHFIQSEIIISASVLLTLLIVYFILPFTGVELMLYAFLLRNIIICIYLLWSTQWPKIIFNNKVFDKGIWIAMLPLLLGAGIFKTSTLIDRYYASQATVGAITILYLAQTLMTNSAMIIERSIAAPLIPKISRLINSNNYIEVKILLNNFLITSAKIVCFILFFVFLADQFLAKIISFFLEINISNAKEILNMFLVMGGHFYSAIVGGLIVSIYYSCGDTLTPVLIGLFGFFIGFLLKWILFDSYGIYGLSISNSIYFFSNIAIFLFFFKIKTNLYGKKFKLFGK